MAATILGALIGGILLFLWPSSQLEASLNILGWGMPLFSGLLFMLAVLVQAIALPPLQKMEQTLTPRLLSLYSRDKFIRGAAFLLYIFPLISIAMTAEIAIFQYFNPMIVFAVWLFLLGFMIDLLHSLMVRVTGYLNPFAILDHLAKEADTFIKEEEDMELCNAIDALAEISIKAVDSTLPSLSIQAVESMQKIAAEYLGSEKSITHHDSEQKGNGSTNHLDKVSYTLFYLFQRLELLNGKALQKDLEPVCSALITSLGKIAVAAAKYDLSMATYPLHYLGKFAAKAQKHPMHSVAEKATCTLLEVSKIIVNEVDVKYLELKEPFFCVTQRLEEIAKENFRQDKSTNIALLTQPFRDLKKLFESDKVSSHRDTPVIVADIERVISQFDQLELVMRTIPPINLPEDERH